MSRYPDYCPISLGAEVLGDRWTPLIIRELMVGSTGFNEIHRGLPRMSRTLLAQRLRALERRGLVRREIAGRGHPGHYALTPAGEGLTPIVWAMGQWAAEWEFADPREEQCDGLTLLWRMHQQAVPRRLPQQRTVVHLRLTGPGAAEGWLDIDHRVVSVCKDNPGCDVDLVVEADTGHLQRWLIGLAPFHQLVTQGHAQLVGPSRLTRAFPGWFDTTLFAAGLQRASAREATPASA